MMAPDIDELATRLFRLDLQSLATREVTARITGEIVAWAMGRGWSPRTEARVLAGDVAERASRLGYLDVVVRRGPGQTDLAIEIDSFHKPWSLDKLRHAAAGGMDGIWIRWGDDEWAGVYEDVDVIQLYTYRVTASRSTRVGQLELRL